MQCPKCHHHHEDTPDCYVAGANTKRLVTLAQLRSQLADAALEWAMEYQLYLKLAVLAKNELTAWEAMNNAKNLVRLLAAKIEAVK